MKVTPYTDADEDGWDAFVGDSHNGTFLHSRRYLSYHGSRFRDASLRLLDGRGRLVGVLPAAIDPHDSSMIVSHPGITYGGLVRGAGLQGGEVVDALGAILDWYREHGYRTFLYKAIPTIYHRLPAEDDLYALFRHGAERTRCDLSSAVNLAHRPPLPRSLVGKLGKAQSHGLRIEHDALQLSAFWAVLTDSLARHGVAPVHSVEEMGELISRFPDRITLVTAFLGSELVAGNVLFTTPQTVHAQYGASSDRGRSVAAQDLLDEFCINAAKTGGNLYFNFGISTEQDGAILNEGLHSYKAKFGAGGVVHEFYLCRLSVGGVTRATRKAPSGRNT